MPISIRKETNKRGQIGSIFVTFSSCPPEVMSAFAHGFPLYKFDTSIGGDVTYKASFLNEAAAFSSLFALSRFNDAAAGICDDYEMFMDEKASWEDRLYAVKRKYQSLRSNVSDLRGRVSGVSGVSQSSYGAGKHVLELAERLAAVELELDGLATTIVVSSW